MLMNRIRVSTSDVNESHKGIDNHYKKATQDNCAMDKTVYELSYHSCACPKVLSGQISNPEQSECSRQSILYVLSQLEPNSSFQVEILESVLRGREHCKFRITKQNQDSDSL